MPEKRSVASKGPRTRSFGGCVTCRSRHVKCDEGRPSCMTCRYLGLRCGGYGQNIFFDTDDNAGDSGVIRVRRFLLTEEERQRMSECMTSQVPPKSALWHISQIDEECETAASPDDLQIVHGPFGAFKVNTQRTSPLDESSLDDVADEPSLDDIEEIGDCLDYGGDINENIIPSETALSPWTQRVFQSLFDFPDQPLASSSAEYYDMTIDTGRIQEIFDDMPLPEMQNFPINPMFSMSSGFSPSFHFSQFPPEIQLNPWPVRTSPSPLASFSGPVPQHTVLLLNHFGTTVINSLSPYRHSKTPWHILFIPHARQCLAALTLGEELDDASLTAFYGMLAISAFSLGGQSKSQMWLDQGRLFKQQAREKARLMLKTAYNIPKVAKYKTILLALITMVQVSIFSGNRDQTECYLLETEKFIRMRGLTKKKSRKVRLLHHCYAFERMFHESTFIIGANSSQRHHVRKAIISSGLDSYSHDSLTFRLPHYQSLDQEMLETKSQEVGENDLHLETPGNFPTTLYPEIFGIPEICILLLSLTIRLGYEKDASEQQQNIDNPLTLAEFVRRAKEIERRINQLQTPISQTQSIDQTMLNHILDALQNALAIYFYRRIYDVDSSMLQTRVSNVLSSLISTEPSDQTTVHGSARFIWPAFIAACEAESPQIQQAFSEWFKKSADKSGLSIFSETLERIQTIWTEKKSPTNGGRNVTWLDIMRNNFLLSQRL